MINDHPTAAFARDIRLIALELCHLSKASHIGGALSVADVLAVLYNDLLRIDPERPDWPARDRLFYSKGHTAAALYAALCKRGFFPLDDLREGYAANGSYYTSHINHRISGVELSTGSLGHALGVACGVALAGKRRQQAHDVVTIVSDGELDEGSNWEAILFAAHHALDNLLLIVDYNKIQSFGTVEEVMVLEPLADKLRAFNWDVEEVDGHDLEPLTNALRRAKQARNGKPACVIAHTIKGKGVDFMENKLAWHYKSPNDSEYQAAVDQVLAG